MGLLDDAIREHLDLKRRRGADPAEVERAEREALGPVRRNREPAAAAESDGPDLAPEAIPGAYDQAGEDEWAYAEEPPERAPAPLAFVGDDEPERYDDSPPFDDAPAYDDDPAPAAGRPVVDEPLTPAPPPRFATDPGVETAEHAVSEEDDDMLDQTPEFLQDTPDHDQLWFEQRPPKDFDFDG